MDLREIVREEDMLFVAVYTPQGDENSPDLSSLGSVHCSMG
jgi:UDP-glucose 6-dehydrogenase